jgi:hypothetical protein
MHTAKGITWCKNRVPLKKKTLSYHGGEKKSGRLYKIVMPIEMGNHAM